MRERLYGFLFFVLLLAGCNNNEQNPVQNKNTSEGKVHNKDKWFKRYTGTLGGMPIVVTLLHYRSETPDDGIRMYVFQGAYHYKNKKESINITSTGSRGDSVILSGSCNEYSIKENAAPAVSQWIVVINDNTIEGRLITKGNDGNSVIDLKENYDEGSYPLEIVDKDDSTAVLWDNDTAHFRISVMAIGPSSAMNNADAEFLNKKLLNILDGDKMGAKNINELPMAMNNSYIESYRKHIQEAKNNKEEFSGTYNNEIEMRTRCVYNGNGFLAFEFDSYGYEGGMHGSYNTSTACLDIRSKKQLHLSDIVIDSIKLCPLLNKQVRNYFELLPNEPLSNKLNVDDMPLTANFTISDSGLVFCYNPYEIAGFVYGQIELFLAYKEIGDMLKPEFRKRMNL